MSISIADLPVVDDLNVPVTSESYADQSNPAPPAPGNYRFQIVKAEPKTTKDGQLILQDGKFPIIQLVQVKIVEPAENERLVGLFQDVKTKPSIRKDKVGKDVSVTEIYDLLRAFDGTATIEGFEGAKTLLQQYLDTNATFVGGLAWQAYDKDYVDAEFEKLNATTYEARKLVAKEIQNAIYNKARKKTKDFIVNGARVSSITGPSGQALEARPVISRYFATTSDEFARVSSQLGPFKK